jgi:hypothetical protein
MATKTKPAKATPKAKPVLHVQIGGVRIPIWENTGEDGSYLKAGEPELSYKGRDGAWHRSKSYGTRELVNLIKAAALAHSEILQRSRKEPPAGETDEETGE